MPVIDRDCPNRFYSLLTVQNGNDPVEAYDWFHGNITKEEAASKLAKGERLIISILYQKANSRNSSI